MLKIFSFEVLLRRRLDERGANVGDPDLSAMVGHRYRKCDLAYCTMTFLVATNWPFNCRASSG
jgi:hypothetical protein